MYPFEKYVISSEVVMNRNLFYQISYRFLLMICLLMILLDGLLMFFILYERKNIPQPVYFATTTDGTLLNLVPVTDSNMEPASLLQWATDAAINSYTFNFVNYRQALQDTRSYFTRTGYNSFLTALQKSNNLEAVQKSKYVVYAQLEKGSNATILRDSNSDPSLRINGAFTWQVQLPMLLTYERAGEQAITQRIVLTLLIRRISSLESSKGVGIDSFVVREIT